jgi:hypothetical protein
MKELLEYLGFTAPFIYAAAAYGFFHWLDENASDEAKVALARTMRFKDYKNQHVASALVEVFDRIYTYPLLHWRAFLRSLLFTTVVSAIFEFEANGRELPEYWRWILIGFLFNVPSDYLSLFVIRPLLIRSGTKPVISLTLGTMSGAAIVLALDILRRIVLLLTYPQSGYGQIVLDLAYLPRLLWEGLGPSLTWFSILFFLLAALAVFGWLPLFALGILTARVLTPLSWIVGRTQWFLKEGNEHPLKAIGYVAAVAVFVGTIAARAVFSS